MLVGLMICAMAAVPVESLRDWTIVVAPDASASEAYAAEELRGLLKQAIGAELAVSRDTSVQRKAMLVGPGASGEPAEKFGEEELLIRVGPERIVITGGRPRGTLYGVYEFCERYLGCEFLTFDQTYFPPVLEMEALPEEEYSYAPPFSFRWSYYKQNGDHHEFATRNRVNTVATEEKLGGKTPQNLIGHSYYRWINPETYKDTHPEYFALVDGVRQFTGAGGGAQPCPTNPEVVEIIAQGVLADLEKDATLRNVTVAQNDNGAYCRCPQCEEINQREGTPMGANLALVNAVAERVEKTHPDVMIGTLAYWYTRKPPKTLKPRHNVQIQLCSIECCSRHAINDASCKLNQSFCDDVTGWKALTDQIWIWNYNTNFSFFDLPFPNLMSIGPNVQFFLDSHAKGVFMQGNALTDAGEMCQLRNYVISKCLWKPGQDSWALAQRFCKLYYGAAADEMIDYLTMLHRVSDEAGFHPDCGPTAERIGLTAEVSKDIVARFGRMMSLAENDTIRARVEEASLPAYKAALMTSETRWDYADGVARRVMPEEATGYLDRYVALCRKYNMTMHAESVKVDDFLKTFEGASEVPATRIENAVWRVTVTPKHNGSIVGLFHKPSGRELLRAMKSFTIEKGILETFVETGTYRRTWNMETVAETTPDSITCVKTLEDGTREERVVRLLDEKPERVRVEFKITQPAGKSETWRFTSQAGFHPGSMSKDADVVSVYVNNGGWKRVNRDWLIDKGPDAGLLDGAKDGGYAFFNHETGYGALISYAPAEVGELKLYWHPERPQLNMELRTQKVELQPGQSLGMAYGIEYLGDAPK
ncbi:MAG: DUF4838 domain-containing protein [FCB group bacterium]|jgi:hypothetical protein|nr:DUF4838 domain-containing protein [FCB group bacterium]